MDYQIYKQVILKAIGKITQNEQTSVYFSISQILLFDFTAILIKLNFIIFGIIINL